MINFHKVIPYTSSIKKQFIIASIIGVFLSFIILFLQPFNSNNFTSENKTTLFLGFGVLLFITYLTYSRLESFFYYNQYKKWTIKHEILSLLFFLIISGSIIFLYNHLIINNKNYSLKYHYQYFFGIVIFFIPIIFPLIIFLRNKFGNTILTDKEKILTLKGSNKNEELMINKNNLLYIKASENYIEIVYMFGGEVHKKMFRNTLSNIHKQLTFLKKSHRSYLVNISKAQSVIGNSQKAFIKFRNLNIQIPLSKSYYKEIKQLLSINPNK